jgi:hypothetical protein
VLGVAAALLLFASGARAQTTLTVTTPAFPAPIANAVTHASGSSITFNVANTKANTKLRQIEFRLPSGYVPVGGLGPPGWTVTRTTNQRRIRFAISDCSQNGIASGETASFRLDVTAPTGWLSGDVTDTLSSISPSDPCGGTTGWSVTSASSVQIPRKTLRITGTVSPAQGAPPLAATATYTITNLTGQTKSGIALSPSVAPATGWTSGGCSPATLSLAAGASANFTCSYTLTGAPQSYTFGATAAGAGVSAVGTSAGSVLVGAVIATFAFDSVSAGVGDEVRATLSVRNQGASAISVTPPPFSALVLQNVVRETGAPDPAPAIVAPGDTADFVYPLTVSGLVGAQYVARGTASTTAGATNLAVTPPGTVAWSRVEWAPAAVVKTRSSSPYKFVVTVTNNSRSSVSEVQIINPQKNDWTGIANSGGSTGLAYSSKSTSGQSETLKFTGTLAGGATATLRFQFTGVPTVSQTTFYPFQVKVIPNGAGTFTTTYDQSIASARPIDDVANLTILSSSGGNVLSWLNTERADAPHDGVVVFRTPAPGVPTVPADFVDYADPANQPADYFFADRDGGVTDTLADPETGVFHYRVCNRDALYVYSDCTSGFWNAAGWLDSAVPPPGGWTHQLGGFAALLPGIVPGDRVAIATNRPSIAVFDVATGDRSFDPVSLAALPSFATPAAELGNGRTAVFAADASGKLTAIDGHSGAIYWQVTKTGESFLAGVSGIIRKYTPKAFQAAYPMDVLLVGSTTGRVLAIDATTGATLWTVTAGAGVYALVGYDVDFTRMYVPTNGGGVEAYDLTQSSSTGAPPAVTGWVKPAGTYRLPCTRGPAASDIACVDTAGVLRVVDKTSGAARASFATGVASPTTLRSVTTAPAGYVVSSTSRVQRLGVAGTAPPLTVTKVGEWAPAGLTLSPVLVSPGTGGLIVGASDKKLHKLSLVDASDTGISATVTPESPSAFLGPAAYDVVNGLFVFGTSDGRVWAVKKF